MEGWDPHTLRGIGLVAAGTALWLVYHLLKDRLQPEPLRFIFLSAALGALAAPLALGVFRFLPHLGLPAGPGASMGETLVYTLACIGPVEEGLKWLGVRATVARNRAFDEPIDGLVYASVAGIGFAAGENLLWNPFLDWPVQLARCLAAPVTHAVFASIWGYGLTRARFTAQTRLAGIAWQVGLLLAASFAHGVYDFVLLSGGAPWVAALLTLVLWAHQLRTYRRLAGRSAEERRRAA